MASHLLHPRFLLSWFFILTAEVLHSSEIAGYIRTTLCYIPENGNFHNYFWNLQILHNMDNSFIVCLYFVLLCSHFHSLRTSPTLLNQGRVEGESCMVLKKKLHGLSPRANYTDRATAACRQSDCQLWRVESATWSGWRIPTVFSVF
jgi:hypothetical protein